MSDGRQISGCSRGGARPTNFRDRVGQQYGWLTVLSLAPSRNERTFWLCVCRCGKQREVAGSHLVRSPERCVCSIAHPKWGHKNKAEYGSWMNTRSRCTNPKNKSYPDYGARGVRFHEAWHDFSAFIRDVGPRPGPGYSLDRIDPTGHYEPGNVRWADRKTQNNNKRLSESRVKQILERAAALFGPSSTDVIDYVRTRLFDVGTDADVSNLLAFSTITES